MMTELGGSLVSSAVILGILIGVAGMILVALAYHVYHRVLKKEWERIEPEILRLADALIQ